MEVKIYTNPQSQETIVYAFDDALSGNRRCYSYNSENSTITSHDLRQYEGRPEVPTFLKLQGQFAADFFKAIVNELNNKGVKPEEDSVNQGKLLATQLHLKDLQDITKNLFEMNKMSMNVTMSTSPVIHQSVEVWTDKNMKDFAKFCVEEAINPSNSKFKNADYTKMLEYFNKQ